MKHITLELELKLRELLEHNTEKVEDLRKFRDRMADIHGEDLPDPPSNGEAALVGFCDALKFVLNAGECE